MRSFFLSCLFFILVCGKAHAQLSFTILSSGINFNLTCSNPTLSLFATSSFSAPVSYTWTSPLGGNSVANPYIVSSPGIYTISAESGTISATQTLSILTSTIAPDLNVSFSTNTLSCAVPSVQLQASSSVANVTYTWASPSLLPWPTSSSVQVYTIVPIPPSTVILTLTITYTLVARDPANGCKTNTVVNVYQNIFPPNAMIATTSSAFTCLTPSIVLTNNSTNSNPVGNPFPFPQPVIGFAWYGPSVSPPGFNTSIYPAYTPGTYTLIAKDMNNGCMAPATITLADSRIYPIVMTQSLNILPCPGTVTLFATDVINPIGNNLTFSWTAPATASVSGVNTATLITNTPGYYQVAVTNTFGCTTNATVTVWACVNIHEQTQAERFISAFPNPAMDKLHLGFSEALTGGASLTLMNALGQVVSSKTHLTQESDLDLSFLTPGIYYLRVQSGKRQNVFKIVKE